MTNRKKTTQEVLPRFILVSLVLFLSSSPSLRAQRDPAEPPAGKLAPKLLPRPAGAISRGEVDEAGMRSLIEQLVACGTRNSLSSWTDPKRGVGCGRDRVVARLNEIAKNSGGRLQVVVDKFEGTGTRTNNKPADMENVYGVLPGSDARLAKTVFIISGHFDSRASDVMDPNLDAPGADDDASGAAVSMECARLLSRAGPNGQEIATRTPRWGNYRATLLFAAVSGEEQGLLGAERMLSWAKQQGYTVGGMLDNDIVGADSAPGAPHRVRLFSGAGDQDDADSPSRELARAIEEIDGRDAVRLIFSLDRLGRGGDHEPFYRAGLPAVRFTEPLEDYRHQHQTPRMENGVEYGDQIKYLNLDFSGNVARANAEALRQLALAPAVPANVKLGGGVTPDAKISWSVAEDPERAGFEILWRETSEPRWQVFQFVTSAGDTVLKGVSTDNHFFAVRSVGKNGARSIAVAASAPRTPPF
ncbi:MAG: aminopeptidase [Acidobacteria bacterium]|nr:MAG: aminopeptidase [Acidobacteriota bacterium]